jgi:hypothetical protein
MEMTAVMLPPIEQVINDGLSSVSRHLHHVCARQTFDRSIVSSLELGQVGLFEEIKRMFSELLVTRQQHIVEVLQDKSYS